MIHKVAELLGRCGTPESILPPTELYNEGWMLRLVLDWFDRHRTVEHRLALMPDARWYSEALLPSQFLPRERGDRLAESFTHADAVIGHFDIKPGVRGDAVLQTTATQFVVTEAKLGSALSKGTTNAPNFDQAARNVACMAHMIGAAGVTIDQLTRIGFYVVAPQQQIEARLFGVLATHESVRAKVAARIAPYDGAMDAWYRTTFEPVLARLDIDVLSWESILELMPETAETDRIQGFYEQCIRFNPMRGGRTTRGIGVAS